MAQAVALVLTGGAKALATAALQKQAVDPAKRAGQQRLKKIDRCIGQKRRQGHSLGLGLGGVDAGLGGQGLKVLQLPRHGRMQSVDKVTT